MDKLAVTSRSAAAAPCFDQLPHEVLQHVLHYLPVKSARNVFRLLSKGYLASTDYLRVAGLVQGRIRSMAAAEMQGQAVNRFGSLLNDCMDERFPTGTTVSLVMELIDALPRLPAADRADAMRAVLSLSSRLGEKAGHAVREKCMERCIHTYQRSSEMDASMPKFQPLDEEEAALAARHFCCDLDPAIVTFEQTLNHLENLHAAMGWASAVANGEERGRLLTQMCEHGVATFTVFNQMVDDVRETGQSERFLALRSNLAQAAMQLLPAQRAGCQAALISLALEVSAHDRTSYQRAASAGRRLIAQTKDDAFVAGWAEISEGLFRTGVVKSLIKRAQEWPDPESRLLMLKHLASVAFGKGALQEMESLCAMIHQLVPPQAAPLYELMRTHADTLGSARVEVIVLELVPALIALPAGEEKFALIEAASRFVFSTMGEGSEMSREIRLGILYRYCFESYRKLIETTFHIKSAADQEMRHRLRVLAAALSDQAKAIPFEFGARAAMRSALIFLLHSLTKQLKSD